MHLCTVRDFRLLYGELGLERVLGIFLARSTRQIERTLTNVRAGLAVFQIRPRHDPTSTKETLCP